SCQKYDYVFFTTGTMSYNDPFDLKGLKGYIHSPYPANQTLAEVDDDDAVAIIGTGLASLDVVRHALSHHQRKPIVMASRVKNMIMCSLRLVRCLTTIHLI
ncbi:hypothetical protein DD924_19405, partial [Staphylococcus pseudintermedius]